VKPVDVCPILQTSLYSTTGVKLEILMASLQVTA
jgi:hypothetical protein